MTHVPHETPDDSVGLPHLPLVHGRFSRRVVTKQVLKYRVRELCGQGFGFRYFAPRVAASAAIALVLLGAGITIYAVRTESLPGDAVLSQLRRSLEDTPLLGEDAGTAHGQLWRAERRLSDARVTETPSVRRALLRDFESHLDAAELHLSTLAPDEQVRMRMNARALESEAVLLVRSWPEAVTRAASSPTSTWVVDAEHDVPILMRGEHQIPFGSAASDDPIDSMSLQQLLEADAAFDTRLAPVLVRLRSMVRDGSPYLAPVDVERYARYLLTE